MKSNLADAARAPTIPTGKKLFKQSTDFNGTNSLDVKNWITKWHKLFLLIMDKDSMSDRPFWAWFEHKSMEAR
eukprot:11423444-Ditylum_brightwellii.AAC.1